MSEKNIILNDGELSLNDCKNIISSNNKHSKTIIHGEAEIMDNFGNLLQKKSNIILLGGRRFILEKLFNVELPTKRVTLNQLFNVAGIEPTTTKGPLQQKMVALWGVGRGGSSMTFGDVNVPAEKEYNLYDMIPMRYVPVTSDLTEIEKKSYYLRVPTTDGNYIAYYLKKFEYTPKLVIKIGEEEYSPNTSPIDGDNLPTNWDDEIEREDVDMYIEISLKLSADDVREFFIETENINTARINELGIYLGYNAGLASDSTIWEDYVGIEEFSKLTFNNEPLDDETKELNITYKFFI